MNQPTPDVIIINALKPEQSSVSEPALRYEKLSSTAIRQVKYDAPRWSNFLSSEADSIEEEKKAEQLALQYLLQTADKVTAASNPNSVMIWSDRFTQASSELFGEPDSNVATQLLCEDYRNVENEASLKKCNDINIQRYVKTLNNLNIHLENENNESSIESVKKEKVVKFFSTQLDKRFGEILNVFDDADIPDTLSPQDIQKHMSAALNNLIDSDSRWQDWTVQIVKGANISRSGNIIKVGEDQVSMSKNELKGLFAHEVLVHGLRSINGAEKSELLKKGLPRYLSSEEGIATLVEYSMSGEVPQKIIDRYTDIALALGKIGGKKFSRQELYDFVLAREKVRVSLGRETYKSDEELEKKCSQHVVRIYRGTQGNDHIGVFTKDCLYYEGFHAMLQYISSELEQGKDEDELYNFLMLGKFDPLNEMHVKFVKE